MASHRESRPKSPTGEDKIDTELERELEKYYQPQHVWYAATVFPICSGSFGPMASAFNIIALAEDWRLQIPSSSDAEGDEMQLTDPRWLIAVNAVSLTIAIIGNLALLLNLAHRISFAIGQAITIVGWLISSALLLAVIGVTRSQLSPGDTLAQPFFYGCIAAGMYFVLASLLVVTTLEAYAGRFPADFSSTLNLSQRTLMVQSMVFIIYLVAGAAVFARIEAWQFTDGIYWSTVTLLTIGYGDVVPVTHLGRSLMIPYAIAGIITLGLVVGSIGVLVLDRGAQKIGARAIMRERSRLSSALPDVPTQLSREKHEFNIMRTVQSKANSKKRRFLLVISAVALCILWFIGALIFWQTESTSVAFQSSPWSYFEGIYFVFISLLTVGYGDFSVKSNAGRPLFVFWGMLAVPTMTILITSMGAMVLLIVKGIIQKVDGFVVLSHESGREDSFGNKAVKMGKLKARQKLARVRGEDEEQHLQHDGGVRNTDTGEVLNAEKQLEDISDLGGAQMLDKNDDEKKEIRYLIAKEINNLLQHISDSPPRTYTFEEWHRFLHLIGIRERFGWLQDDSPLMSDKTETEWALEKLCKRLEEELQEQRKSSS